MPRGKGEGITKITVKGFKSIVEERVIDIRPLTILAGANSSGKSSIMQPLLLLKQTLEVPYDPGPLLLYGPNVQFTEMEQFLSKLESEKRKTDRFQIGVETSDSDDSFSAVTTIFKKGQSGIEIVKMMVDQSISPEHATLYPKMSPEEAIARINQHPRRRDFEEAERFRCFLALKVHRDAAYAIASPVKSIILSGIHLPGLRGNPERIYKLTSTGPRYPGTFENYVASLIHEWQETKDKRLKRVTDALRTLGLTKHIGTKKIGDVGIELQVGRRLHDSTNETDMVNITDVGLGVSQVLPVLVALIVAEPGQLVYIEQPELHLHPRAQVALAQVLADAGETGCARRSRDAQLTAAFGRSNACCRRRPSTGISQTALVHTPRRWCNRS